MQDLNIQEEFYIKEAEKLWNKIISFSGYGFNFSHAYAYAMMSYQAQWLKANFPLEFWTTAISFAKEEEIPAMLNEIDHLKQGIKVKPPSINNSTLDFTCDPETNHIYWSLTKIKGLGVKTIQPIIEEREKNGLFKNYQDFVERVPKAKVNKAHIEKLILAGAFDNLGEIHQVTERINLIKEHCKFKQYPLPEQYTRFEEINKIPTWIRWQKGLTGLGTIPYKNLLKDKQLLKIYKTNEQFFETGEYTEVCLCGNVYDLIRKKTKKGSDFYILNLMINNESIKCLIWDNTLEDHIEMLENCLNKEVYLTGKVRFDTHAGQNALHFQEESKFGFL